MERQDNGSSSNQESLPVTATVDAVPATKPKSRVCTQSFARPLKHEAVFTNSLIGLRYLPQTKGQMRQEQSILL